MKKQKSTEAGVGGDDLRHFNHSLELSEKKRNRLRLMILTSRSYRSNSTKFAVKHITVALKTGAERLGPPPQMFQGRYPKACRHL